MTPQEAYNKARKPGGKTPELEPAISQDAEYSYWYSTDVIKGRLPDFMHNRMIFSNDEYAKHYLEYIK